MDTKSLLELFGDGIVSKIIDYVIGRTIDLGGRIFRGSLASREEFESRAKLFHEHISPIVIGKLNIEIYNALYKMPIKKSEEKALPFIDLAKGKKTIKLPKHLFAGQRELYTDKKLIEWLTKNLEKKIKDNPTFTLNGIREDGELAIGMGRYISTISTCDAHYFNMIRYFPISMNDRKINLYMRSSPMLRWVNHLNKIVTDQSFSHYTASLGCSVLTVIRKSENINDGYHYLIVENSSEKGSAAVDRHVVPSFMFQPVCNQAHNQELNIKLSIIREYGEELFNIENLEEGVANIEMLRRKILNHAQLASLDQAFETGAARWYITGLILDIYRLRPELTLLLIIEDCKMLDNIQKNWEISKINFIDLLDESSYVDLITSTQYPLCPPGLAALIFGRKKALGLLKKFMEQPSQQKKSSQSAPTKQANSTLQRLPGKH